MLKKLLAAAAALAIVLAVSSSARGQGKDDEQAVRTAFNRMVNADLTDNADELDKCVTEDFTVTRDNGAVRSRAESIDGLRSGATKFEKFDISDLKIRIYGETALVTFGVTIKGSRAGQEFGGRFREVRLFVKRAGQWKAAFLQRTAIAGS